MISDDFCLNNTFQEKVLKVMINIESSKAVGVDKLSGRFLKEDTNILAKPISAFCNLSISKGIFPNACKKTDLSNYRPISWLP